MLRYDWFSLYGVSGEGTSRVEGVFDVGEHIEFSSEFPGPKSRKLMEEKKKYVPDAFGIHVPVAVEKARGALLTDVDGNTYIDLAGGVGVLNVGHSASSVVEAVKEQIDRYMHTDFTVVMYEPWIKLAKRLDGLAPGDTDKKSAFFNSGAEAVENSVKIARKFTGKSAIIVFEGAFHGRTQLAMTLTSKPKPYKQGFGPYAPEVYRVPFAYCYRCPLGQKGPESCDLECAEAFARAFHTQVAPEDTAAVMLEPVQGEGGFIVPPEGYLQRIKEIAEENDILFIADEVQTGFGRTGKMFACEHFGVEPDLLVIAKSLGGGLPISGVVGKDFIMDEIGSGQIGGTYVGNPVACTAGLAVCELMEEEALPERGNRLGEIFMERFEQMKEDYELIGDVRGLGAMTAVELVKDRETKEPATEETDAVMKEAMKRGVLGLKAGIYGNVLRMLAPLVITEEQLHEALDALEMSIAEVSKRR